jgi:hypothetical protein
MLRIITLFSFFLFGHSLHAQIVEAEKVMSEGSNNALILEIPEADDKIVEKVWKSYAKSFDGKVKNVKKSDDQITISPNITGFAKAGLQNIYVRFVQQGENVVFHSWFELEDQYLNSYNNPDEFDEAQKVLLNFGLEVAKEYTIMELDEEEKTLKKMKSDLKKLAKDKENYEKAIKDYEQKIIDAQADIENNLIEQERMGETIEAQNEAIEMVKKKLANLNN